jgi:hypothetical protein
MATEVEHHTANAEDIQMYVRCRAGQPAPLRFSALCYNLITLRVSEVHMQSLRLMMLLVLLSSCTWTSPFDSFSKDKEDCEQKSRGSSPFANTTSAAADDQFAACMNDRGWQNIQR